MTRALLLLILALPAACDNSGQGVGGVSAEEAKALNQAAEKIDARMANTAMPPPDASQP